MNAATSQPTNPPKPAFTYVIVHGAWGGGWAFKEVDHLLTADGNTVYRPTLTGQGERVHLSTPDIDLNTHITDIVNVILFENLHNIVLVGHSYGGMVITGVADRVPDRIAHLVYVDAFLPENGESANTMRRPGATTKQFHPETNGYLIPEWLKPNTPLPHDVPMPAKTFSQPISLSNPAALKIPTTYILTVDPGKQPEDDTFYYSYERAKSRGYRTLIMEGDHNVQWSHPKELVHLLEEAPLHD
ncbi:MAG TPA: alpha/beta hydrolase [Tepidisphaeraceae bacterium]|jgi:pimeloyl-ACP methyl ester carboxylesterase|nr:alpha/beta hydrolase [Tepidisphaeraceae bacterium]